jgi:hypothetical protein
MPPRQGGTHAHTNQSSLGVRTVGKPRNDLGTVRSIALAEQPLQHSESLCDVLSKISWPGSILFKVPRAAAFSQNLICACQASLRCCSLMDAGSHAATGPGISARAAGVLRDERAPASCPVGAVGVASPADAIWTGHNSPSAVPRRRAARCPRRRAARCACQPPLAPPQQQVRSKKSCDW